MKTTARTMKFVREKGNKFVGLVERRTPGGTSDLFNIIDIIALTANETVGIQACGSDVSEHIRKITIDYQEEAIAWLSGPRRLMIYGWRKVNQSKTSKRKVWRPRILEVYLSDSRRLCYVEVSNGDC